MSSGHVIWKAVADRLRDLIRSGQYPPGRQLPPFREWQGRAELGNAKLGTARVVVEHLVREGWLETVPGKGVFVAGIPEEQPARTTEEWLANLEQRVQALERKKD